MKEILSAQGFPDGTKVVTSWTRPLKAVYIIPNDNPELAVRAIESSCLTWGGAHHIFVPYHEGISEDWMQVIANYDPDFAVDMAGIAPAEKDHLNARGWFVHDWPSPLTTFLTPGALIYSAAWSFLDPIRPEHVRVVVPQVGRPHPLRLPILARYGSLNEQGIEETLRSHGLVPSIRLSDAVLTAEADFTNHGSEALLDPPVSLESLRGGGTVAVWDLPRLTLLHVFPRPPSRPLVASSSPQFKAEERKHAGFLLVTGDDGCVSDLCLYWTLRANRASWVDPFPLWLPLSQIKSSAGRQVVEAAMARAERAWRTDLWGGQVVYVLSTSASESQIDGALRDLSPREIVTDGFASFIPPGFDRGTMEVYEVPFERGRARIRRPHEEKLYRLGELDRVGQEIQVEGVRLPQVASLKDCIFGVPWRITQRGFQRFFYPRHAEALASIHLPSSWRVVEGLFDEAGYKCTPSPQGRLAVGLLELLGSLERVSILASSRVFSLLAKMAEAEGRQYFRKRLRELCPEAEAHEIDEIERKILDVASPLEQFRHTLGYSDFARALGKSAAQTILTWLVEQSIIFRGAELRCPVCGFLRWYVIDRIGRDFLCEGCQKMSPSPLELASTNWRYRLNELYARAFDQGVLAHVLLAYQRAYMFLPGEDPLLGFYPGVVLSTESLDNVAEIDYVEVRSGNLVIGECKVSGNEFREEMLDGLVSLANSLHCSELILATITSPVNPKPIEKAQEAFTGELSVYGDSNLFDKHPWRDEQESPDDYLGHVVRQLST